MIDFYKENGYVIIKDFLSHTEHKKLLDVSDYYYQKGKGGKDEIMKKIKR